MKGWRGAIEGNFIPLDAMQRGGSPSAYDRVLAARLGIRAGRLAIRGEFGLMVASRGLDIVAVPLANAVGEMRTLPDDFRDEASEFLK
jgi:ATP-dependent phosphofructokinase / diphosphate-dependent phosphofructokinase